MSNSSMHHYKCVALCKDISLQSLQSSMVTKLSKTNKGNINNTNWKAKAPSPVFSLSSSQWPPSWPKHLHSYDLTAQYKSVYYHYVHKNVVFAVYSLPILHSPNFLLLSALGITLPSFLLPRRCLHLLWSVVYLL